MSFEPKESKELHALLNRFVGMSPEEYMKLYGNGALEMLKTKPIPKDDDLIISDRDKLLGTILQGMEDIQIDLSDAEHVNQIDFNFESIIDEQLGADDVEQMVKSNWYQDFEEEFRFHISTNIDILEGYENSTTYWLKCQIGTLTPFLIQLPKLYKIEETNCTYNAFFTMDKSKVQYVHQYYYIGNGQFTSFYQIFWDLMRSKEKIIRRKVERNTEILLLNVIDECIRDAMKVCCTYIGVELSNYSLWLMTRQFKIQELDDGKGNVEYRKIKPEWADIVTGSFGNVGSKFSLKHGVEIKLVDGIFRPVDEGIIRFPFSTERLMNMYPTKAGFKRINVTDIEKHPLMTYKLEDGKFGNPFQDRVPIYMKEVKQYALPESEEINLTCVVVDIKNDIGSLRNNTLDMFNMNRPAMQKLMTADEQEVTIGNKLILPFREKAIIGGEYGDDCITQVICEIDVPLEHKENLLKHFCEQEIQHEQGETPNKIFFIPDLIMNHTNRDNNVALRLLSNLRYESISQNKEITIDLEQSNQTILKEEDQLLVKVYIYIGDTKMAEIETQLLFLRGYHQPTHSAKNTATYGQVNTNYRQALAASAVFTPRDFDHTIKHFDKALFKAKTACSGYEIKEVNSNEIKKHQEEMTSSVKLKDAFRGL